MQATRFQRAMLFAHENDAANKNKIGQGPAAYDFASTDKDRIGNKFAFTIGKVSNFDFQYFYLDGEKHWDEKK